MKKNPPSESRITKKLIEVEDLPTTGDTTTIEERLNAARMRLNLILGAVRGVRVGNEPPDIEYCGPEELLEALEVIGGEIQTELYWITCVKGDVLKVHAPDDEAYEAAGGVR